MFDAEEVTNRIVRYLTLYCQQNGIHYLVTGVSGGVDSAVVLGLARWTCLNAGAGGFPLTSVGLILPCHSSPEAERLGREAIKRFGAEEIKIDLSDLIDAAYRSFVSATDDEISRLLKKTGRFDGAGWDYARRVAQGNIKARLRMTFGTRHVARLLGGLVLSTGNLSERLMGFWTIGGDVGDFAPIQNLLKGSEVYALAEYLGVPPEIIAARPDDGNGVCEGGDEAQLGAPYPVIDKIMIAAVKQGLDPDGERRPVRVEGVPAELADSIVGRACASAFKRHGTFTLSRPELGLPELAAL